MGCIPCTSEGARHHARNTANAALRYYRSHLHPAITSVIATLETAGGLRKYAPIQLAPTPSDRSLQRSPIPKIATDLVLKASARTPATRNAEYSHHCDRHRLFHSHHLQVSQSYGFIRLLSICGLWQPENRRMSKTAMPCARLCHHSGGELEQITFLLGHVSVQTAERCIGCQQQIRSTLNDRWHGAES